MQYLIGLIGILLGALFYQTTKRKSAEGLLQNQDTKEKLNNDNVSIAKDQGLLQAEEEKRKQIEQQNQKDQNESNKDLSDFINKH